MLVLAVVNGKNSFLLSYSNNIENFYKSLPIVGTDRTSTLLICHKNHYG